MSKGGHPATKRVEALHGAEKEAAMNELIYQRIMSRVVVDDSGCWVFTGARVATGYGKVQYNNKGYLAHRFMLQRSLGKPLGDLHACHKCDNPPCCNPDHLFAGDDKANFQDCAAKNRHANKRKTHCKEGHEYTPENTRMVRSQLRGEWKRQCKRCYMIRWRMRAGWSREEAENTPTIPANAKTPRRQWPIPRKTKAESIST